MMLKQVQHDKLSVILNLFQDLFLLTMNLYTDLISLSNPKGYKQKTNIQSINKKKEAAIKDSFFFYHFHSVLLNRRSRSIINTEFRITSLN